MSWIKGTPQSLIDVCDKMDELRDMIEELDRSDWDEDCDWEFDFHLSMLHEHLEREGLWIQ